MLPKVANHLVRAVAAVQNQTGYTIRNVLQLQSSSGPSTGLGGWNGVGSSSSGWGGTGTGPGGAKYHSSSRFYSGYTGSGRAITQANSPSITDGDVSQNDDSDELRTTRPGARSRGNSRPRSHSLSVTGRSERGEKLGVLKTVQMHVRSRHAFVSTFNADGKEVRNLEAFPDSASPSRHVITRRNSTAATLVTVPVDPLPPPTLPTEPRKQKLLSFPWAAPDESVPSDVRAEVEFLRTAGRSRDYARVIRSVQTLRSKTLGVNVWAFNAALWALMEVRKPGEPLHFVVDTFNDMIGRSVLPNLKTYTLLINAFTDRDEEVRKVIAGLRSRAKRRALYGRPEVTQEFTDEKRVEQLMAENNFGSAMSLFQAACSIPYFRSKLPAWLFTRILRACANHSHHDAALLVFGQMEKRLDILPSASAYHHLLSVFINVGDLEGAKAVFEEFRSASKNGRLDWDLKDTTLGDHRTLTSMSTNERSGHARSTQLGVWNTMIEGYFRCGQPTGALDLLEQMMDSKAGEAFGPQDIPPPASSTFTSVISGFCQTGDVASALAWFDRLLQESSPSRLPFEPSMTPSRPDQVGWVVILECLLEKGMLDDLNRLFSILLSNAGREGLIIRRVDRCAILEANIHYLESNAVDGVRAVEILDYLSSQVFLPLWEDAPDEFISDLYCDMCGSLIRQYVRYNKTDKALELAEQFSELCLRLVADTNRPRTADSLDFWMKTIKRFISVVASDCLLGVGGKRPFNLTLREALRVARLCDSVAFLPSASTAAYYLEAYARAKAAGQSLDLSLREWELLAYAAAVLTETAEDKILRPSNEEFAGVESFIMDLGENGVDPSTMNGTVMRRLLQAMQSRHGSARTTKLCNRLGPGFQKVLNDSRVNFSDAAEDTNPVESQPRETLPVSWPRKNVRVDPYQSRFVDEFYPSHPKVTPDIAFARFEEGARGGKYPSLEVIGRLINHLGREGKMDKVFKLYDGAQCLLSTMEHDKQSQSRGWFQIEDQMIVACAHGGNVEAAHIHRTRILENGAAPSADAYGSLISTVKDTTDDASNAMSLFEESQLHGVISNTFLYNTVISKLAKARKADFALELFQQMKATGHRPTSVTYGAVIAACCRVGDAHSAEQLFRDMTIQANFKPRVPPYNTMIQFYVHTKPDRERALYYFDALLKSRIWPSAHTYKLLLDAYGNMQPVDVQAMERVFNQLTSDPNVQVSGIHWAPLINSWGCVQKNLDKAVEVFESISSHPTSARSTSSLPDAVAYESLINVFVTLRRTDLIPQYIQRLRSSHVHMTAYIANLIIKGYAAAGDIEQARNVFESLADPPEGVAAPNNRVSYSSVNSNDMVTDAPVFREPSTWEAMVRAELGVGNHDRAVALLERLQSRKYPPAVYSRISGIMLDDSVSPWSSSDDSSPSSGGGVDSQ